MPRLPRRRSSAAAPRVVVLGDLMLDVVVSPSRPLETGTDAVKRLLTILGADAQVVYRRDELIQLGPASRI